MTDPYYYGADKWNSCSICQTRRPPGKLKEAFVITFAGGGESIIGMACADDWCQKAEKLDELLVRVEALREAKHGI